MRKGLAVLVTLVMLFAFSSAVFAWESECMYGTPTIDGEVDDLWDYAETLQMKSYSTDKATGTCKCLWDEDNLYFLFEMEDSAQFAKGINEGNDSVEVWIDEQNLNQTSHNESVGDNDFHYRVDINGTVTSNINSNDVSDVGITNTNTTYNIEFSVPYHSITPKVGLVIGFTPSANTDDDGDGKRNGYMNCNSGYYWKDPSVYDDLVLVESKVPSNPATGDSMTWVYVSIVALVLSCVGIQVLRKKAEA